MAKNTHCILNCQEDGKPKQSICGNTIVMDWHFVSLEHAIANHEKQGRVTACKKCVKKTIEQLLKMV